MNQSLRCAIRQKLSEINYTFVAEEADKDNDQHILEFADLDGGPDIHVLVDEESDDQPQQPSQGPPESAPGFPGST